MKRYIFFIFIVLNYGITQAIDPSSEEDPYFLLMGEAEKAIEEGDFEEAAARLIDAIAVDPSNPSNLLVKSNLGMVYSCLDRDSMAIATLDEVINIAPKMTVAILNRAKVELKINQKKEAYADFSKVIELDSLNADARYFRGIMALYEGNLQTAETDLLLLESKQPNARRTYDSMSALYSMSGRDREAIKYLKNLIDIDAQPEYFATLAGCYLAIDELSDAAETIANGLKRYPTDPELYYYRARLNKERFRLDEAKEDAKKALKYGISQSKIKKLGLGEL